MDIPGITLLLGGSSGAVCHGLSSLPGRVEVSVLGVYGGRGGRAVGCFARGNLGLFYSCFNCSVPGVALGRPAGSFCCAAIVSALARRLGIGSDRVRLLRRRMGALLRRSGGFRILLRNRRMLDVGRGGGPFVLHLFDHEDSFGSG